MLDRGLAIRGTRPLPLGGGGPFLLTSAASLVILSQFVAGCVWIESGIWQDRKINGSLQGDG